MFIHYPHRKRTVPIRVFVPNMLTTVALCCGLASLHYSLKGDWDRAMFAVLLSAVFDGLDGRAARLLKVTSPFGEVLDSLSDFVSFGVAPAVLLHQWMLKDQGWFGLVAVTTFVLCSAMRLARFTAGVRIKPIAHPGAPTPEEQRDVIVRSRFFTGLPTPAAAAAVMVPVMLAYSVTVQGYLRPWFGMPESGQPGRIDGPAVGPNAWAVAAVVAYTLIIGLWMISRLPMFSFKKMRVSRHAIVPMLVGVGAMAALAVKDMWLMMCVLAAAYLGSVVVSIASHRRLHRRPAIEVVSQLKTKPAVVQ
ncbi:MAG: phosphatidylcholine/phosphatidylserine synthase [Phycisphaerales bacterium]|nr:phosphatidylcholine/phosphatidylserine synthase [Phycisphaerales bacterium]